jgi:hypothetical protein
MRDAPHGSFADTPPEGRACAQLLSALRAHGYRFTTPTPTTHGQVVARRDRQAARTLADVFGWNLPFDPVILPGSVLEAMTAADIIQVTPTGLRSTLRVASLGEDLFLHSSFPAHAADAVFFGPDTYRFARFLRHALAGLGEVGMVADIGAGSGAGAVVAARLLRPRRLLLSDINSRALTLARANLMAADIEGEFVLASGLEGLDAPADLIIANPPYMADAEGRTYRDGGDLHGARLSLDWALAAAPRLSPGGKLVLYTGSAIVDGADALKIALAAGLAGGPYDLTYDEIDPDVFGEMLSQPAYADVDRIAAIGAVVTRRPA